MERVKKFGVEVKCIGDSPRDSEILVIGIVVKNRGVTSGQRTLSLKCPLEAHTDDLVHP